MDLEVGTRFRDCILAARKTQRDVAAFLGISAGTLSTFINQGVGLSPKKIADAAENFMFNLDYIYNGDGTMLVEVKMMNKQGQIVPAPHGVLPNVKYLDFRALAANFIDLNVPTETRTILEAWVPWLPQRKKPYYSIHIEGDSMHPTVKDGDWLFLDLLQEKTQFTPGDVYIVIVASGLALCKRIDRIVDERSENSGRISLRSDNSKVPIQYVDEDSVLAVFKIVSMVSNNPVL